MDKLTTTTALLALTFAAGCPGEGEDTDLPITNPPAPDLILQCLPPDPTCDNPGFDMAVLGDVVDLCETQSNGTSIRFELVSSDDPNDRITVAFDGYQGPGSYALDEPGVRYLAIDDSVSFAQCEGEPIDVGKRVGAADPSCGSPACTVEVADEAPAAPFPKPLTFTVECASVCENSSDVTCPGPIDFAVRADCT